MSASVVVFDLDDTLTDWWTAIRSAARAATDEDTADRFMDAVRDLAWEQRADGAVHRAHWKLRVDTRSFWRGLSAGSEAERLADLFQELLRPQLYDDVLPTLRQLSATAVLGVLTNSPYVDAELEALEIADRFATVVGVVDPVRKPHPDAFRRLLHELGRRADEVWYVGDSPVSDVEPALAMGMNAVWIDRFDDDWQPPPGAARVRSLREVVSLIEARPGS